MPEVPPPPLPCAHLRDPVLQGFFSKGTDRVWSVRRNVCVRELINSCSKSARSDNLIRILFEHMVSCQCYTDGVKKRKAHTCHSCASVMSARRAARLGWASSSVGKHARSHTFDSRAAPPPTATWNAVCVARSRRKQDALSSRETEKGSNSNRHCPSYTWEDMHVYRHYTTTPHYRQTSDAKTFFYRWMIWR
jgi:hypothetical protein